MQLIEVTRIALYDECQVNIKMDNTSRLINPDKIEFIDINPTPLKNHPADNRVGYKLKLGDKIIFIDEESKNRILKNIK